MRGSKDRTCRTAASLILDKQKSSCQSKRFMSRTRKEPDNEPNNRQDKYRDGPCYFFEVCG